MSTASTIRFVDLVGQSNDLCEEILPAIERVIRRAQFIFPAIPHGCTKRGDINLQLPDGMLLVAE